MFTNPYSIYIDKRPMRIVFLVNPSQENIEMIDQIINFNRGLWGGRFNPIILTDGNTIKDNWWKFLRDVDPDVIKPLVPLSNELIERFENFLSPLTIEAFREDDNLRLGVGTRISPARVNPKSINSRESLALFGEPILGLFNVDEMDSDVDKLFIDRNFGVSADRRHHYGWEEFNIPISLETALSRGEVPLEVHEGFKEKELQNKCEHLSNEAFCKDSVQHPEKWAIIDKENNGIHYIERRDEKLFVLPYRKSKILNSNENEIEKNIYLTVDRESLIDALTELANTQNIIYRDQICAFPNTERDVDKQEQDRFQVIVGDTIEDLVYFWNKPWLLSRWKRTYMNQLWLPTALATDPDMEDALCAWISKNSRTERQSSKTVQFVSFSTEEEDLKNIASRFQNKLSFSTDVKCYDEPQIPNCRPEYPLFSLREDPFSDRDSSIEIHRGQGNTNILELTEPKGLSQRDLDGHWMADFYIEFTHDRYANHEDVRIRGVDNAFLWQFPNRNHLTYFMFDRFSRIRRNSFPSALIKRGGKVLRLTLKEAESVVSSLFFNNNRHVYTKSDPRTQVTTTDYSRANVSDKGKYLQGVLELFGNLTLAYEVFRNPYWRSMFDILSKNTNAEQNAQVSVANKIRKLIDRSGPLTAGDQNDIESLAIQAINLAKNLTLKQKESPFKAFTAEAGEWKDKYVEGVKSTDNHTENDLISHRFSPNDVRNALSGLTQRNIIQIGVRPQCPNCGMTNWYHVDDIGQQLICQGCRIPFPFQPELAWQYKLNNLAHVAYAQHGTTPLILVLGQLLDESRDSFLYSPNLNLFTKPQDGSSEDLKPTAEIDIACIQDGKFIIGEVKQSIGLFNKNDFDKTAEIAKKVKPDIVLFSCIDKQQPTKDITNHIERIKKELCPLEIDVIWYELKYLDSTYHV